MELSPDVPSIADQVDAALTDPNLNLGVFGNHNELTIAAGGVGQARMAILAIDKRVDREFQAKLWESLSALRD